MGPVRCVHFYELSYALETLQQMNGNVVGLVLNDSTGKSSSQYGRYGSYRAYRYGKSYYRRGYGRGYYSYYSAYGKDTGAAPETETPEADPEQ